MHQNSDPIGVFLGMSGYREGDGHRLASLQRDSFLKVPAKLAARSVLVYLEAGCPRHRTAAAGVEGLTGELAAAYWACSHFLGVFPVSSWGTETPMTEANTSRVLRVTFLSQRSIEPT